MRARLFAWAITIALLTLGADVARAHDIWLFPQTFTLPEGGTLMTCLVSSDQSLLENSAG